VRGIQHPPRLRITEGTVAALIIVSGRTLHPIHRITGNRVALAQMVKEYDSAESFARILAEDRHRSSISLRQAMTCARATVRI
jgi:hypothetical protein